MENAPKYFEKGKAKKSSLSDIVKSIIHNELIILEFSGSVGAENAKISNAEFYRELDRREQKYLGQS